MATRSLRRTPSLRSLVLPRCAQSPSFAALSLRCAQPVASPRHSLRSVRLSRLGSRIQRAGVVALFFGRDGRTDGRTYTRGPMGPRPTHVCLVRETRLLPPKAGRLASRSAKPTLDGSSLNNSCSFRRGVLAKSLAWYLGPVYMSLLLPVFRVISLILYLLYLLYLFYLFYLLYRYSQHHPNPPLFLRGEGDTS